MLADELDYVVGVDTHRDSHALAVVVVPSGVVLFETTVAADSDGYREAFRVASEHAPGRRVFAIEGTAAFGAGLSRFLLEREERVFEVGRLRRERRSSGKTDALDAIRAARSVLTQERGAIPRSSGEREALRALMAAREGAAVAKTAGLNQLHALLVTTPEPLRGQLRGLTRSPLLSRLAAMRPDSRRDPDSAARCSHSARSPGESCSCNQKSANSPARSRSSFAASLLNCSTSQASVRSPPPRCCSAGLTPAASRTRPRSPGSPAPHQSPRHRARRSATASTEAATANSTHAAPDPQHTQENPPPDDRLHRTPHERRQVRREATRCLKRYLAPQPLPPTREPTSDDLTDIEASLAQASDRLSCSESDGFDPFHGGALRRGQGNSACASQCLTRGGQKATGWGCFSTAPIR